MFYETIIKVKNIKKCISLADRRFDEAGDAHAISMGERSYHLHLSSTGQLR
jgi:hypothetical protein